MAITNIFRGAVPFDEALHRLNATFTPKPGDLITHEQLSKVIREPKNSSRYHGVLTAWIKQQRRHNVELSGEGRARGIGLMCPLPNESSEISKAKLKTAKKSIGRRAIIMDGANLNDAADAVRNDHNLTRRAMHSAAAELSAVAKTLPRPPSVGSAGSNVRVLRKG